MTSALTAYLTNGGASYIASPIYEERRLALAEKIAAGPVSFADMSDTLGLPLAVVCELFNCWRAEKVAATTVKH